MNTTRGLADLVKNIIDNRPVDQYIINMKAIGIFEVKTKISEICETVKETREPVLITKRGIPMVRIIPIENPEKESNIWNLRKKFIDNNGLFTEELPLPSRKADILINPLDD